MDRQSNTKIFSQSSLMSCVHATRKLQLRGLVKRIWS